MTEQAQPQTRRLSLLDLVVGASVVALTYLALPLKEQLIRWRRSGPNFAVFLAFAWLTPAFLPPGASPWWGLLVAPPVFFICMVVAHAVVILKEDDVWFIRDGLNGSLVLGGWTKSIPAPGRGYWLHTWAAWPRHHGLGRVVGEAALTEAPRPLWILPATPELRELYARVGAVPHGPRWMVIR